MHEACEGFLSRILKPSNQLYVAVQLQPQAFIYLEYESSSLGVRPYHVLKVMTE